MKKAFLSLALLPIFLHADDELVMEDTKNMTKNEQTPPPPYIEYHNRIAVFGPFHQVYERTKPDAFYAGVESWVVGAYGSKGYTLLGEAELRFGYNLFYNGTCHLTPFIGAGAIKDFKHHHYYTLDLLGHGHKHSKSIPAVVYGVLGFLYDHEFNSVVNLGLNVKGMVGGGVDKKHIDWGSAVVGMDISVPLTFRFGRMRHWDIRIEPFDIFLHGKNFNINYFGLRNTIGYRF